MKNKYVLTGGPGSGKSSIILSLEALGCYVVREAAEDVIRLRQAHGIAEPWKEIDFQDKILALQLRREKEAEKIGKPITFLDRGTLDGLAYYQIQGREPSRAMKDERHRLYRERGYNKVFLIENLGSCATNKVRREDLDQALELERLQEENYREAGYDVIRIAPSNVWKRTEEIFLHTMR